MKNIDDFTLFHRIKVHNLEGDGLCNPPKALENADFFSDNH